MDNMKTHITARISTSLKEKMEQERQEINKRSEYDKLSFSRFVEKKLIELYER